MAQTTKRPTESLSKRHHEFPPQSHLATARGARSAVLAKLSSPREFCPERFSVIFRSGHQQRLTFGNDRIGEQIVVTEDHRSELRGGGRLREQFRQAHAIPLCIVAVGELP